MSIPVLGSIVVGADLTIEVPVDDLGGSAEVRVDYAVAASAPAISSRLWLSIGTVDSPSSLFTMAQVLGTTVWVRASGRTAAGAQTSSYTDPVYVEVVATPTFTSTSFVLKDRVPSVTWEGGPLTVGVRLWYDVHAQETDPGTLSSYEDVEAVYESLELSVELQDGEAITMRLEAFSGWDSDTVAGDEGQNVGAMLVQSPPDVEPHAYTHEVDGTDELDLGNLVITAPDTSRWRLTVSNSGELGTEEIS